MLHGISHLKGRHDIHHNDTWHKSLGVMSRSISTLNIKLLGRATVSIKNAAPNLTLLCVILVSVSIEPIVQNVMISGIIMSVIVLLGPLCYLELLILVNHQLVSTITSPVISCRIFYK
jgi:hypothetical protein